LIADNDTGVFERGGEDEVEAADEGGVEAGQIVYDAIPLTDLADLDGVAVAQEFIVGGGALVEAGELLRDLGHEGEAEGVHCHQADSRNHYGEDGEHGTVGVHEDGAESMGRSV
jgi:hypothetical protein